MSTTATITNTATATPASAATTLNGTVAKQSSEVKKCHYIPWPETLQERRKWQLGQMAGAFRVFAKLGFADGGSGHISLRGTVNNP